MKILIEGPYLSPSSDYWRATRVRYGERRWFSLRTKDREKAQAEVDRMRETIAKAVSGDLKIGT